ncbi:9180_t:CDS:2 [Acaulospora morrowiae]|uniref:9180_t:CDS:1 n=1 Tax=Acaulospora morrowiae TaxID=94023 RepID=A0A9N9F1F5_9GLOM|nr:9180_t:CDS:2 [Acaulospora morrowiae]
METFRTVEDNPPETLQTLITYEEKPGQAQNFLARMGKNFRWPLSMPKYLRSHAFRNIADREFEYDEEAGLNIIFFYNALDRGEFSGHENEWVTVHHQKIIECGQEYSDDQLDHVLETLPGAIQLPVDQTRLPRSPPAKMVIGQRANNGEDYKIRVRVRRPGESNIVAQLTYDFYDTRNNNKKYTCVIDTGAPNTILPYHVKRVLGSRGWSTIPRIAGGYGAPAEQICASKIFEVSIGDDNNWTKWVQARILLWQEKPGNQVEYALVGNDVTDQLAYAHEPRNPLKFLNIADETRLTTDKITELKAERTELKARIAELLRQTVEENKMRDVKVKELEQKNSELETRLAILEQEEKGISIKDVSRSPVNSNDTPASNIPDNTLNSSITPEQMENSSDITSDDVKHQTYGSSDTYQKKNSRSSMPSITMKTTSSEEKKINYFLDSVHKETISEKIRKTNLRSQDKVQKIMSEISENSSSINNDNIDRDVTTTIQDEVESLPSNTNFTLLYGKLCDAIILADRKTQEAIACYCLFGKAIIQRRNEIASERQVDPESNTVSRILNKEVKAQLPTDTSDSLLRKRIEKAKKLYKLFDAIDNVSFDYSINVSLPLAELWDDEKSSVTQLCEPRSRSDWQNSCEKENNNSETPASSILSPNTSDSEDMISKDNKSLPVKEISISTGAILKDKQETANDDNNTCISEKAESLLEEEAPLLIFSACLHIT